jgi:hypothetical protein
MATTWREFLEEHADFPFPHLVENGSQNTTDVSEIEVGLLEREWKAKYAIRNETLVQKICLIRALGILFCPMIQKTCSKRVLGIMCNTIMECRIQIGLLRMTVKLR